MCGIVGFFNCTDAQKKMDLALAMLLNRGKDGFGVGDGKKIEHFKLLKDIPSLKSNCLIGHTLHSVVSFVSQPLQEQGMIVANCELYNWQELSKQYKLNAKNDAEVLLKLLDLQGIKALDLIDGVYALAYWQGNKLILARDILGEKPIWFSHNLDEFAFASEKKVLEKASYLDIQELNPRQILTYNIKENKLSFSNRMFFEYLPEHKDSEEKIKRKISELLDLAIHKRIPSQKFGLLFSGGIDSTFIANYFKQNGYDFTCYTAVLDTDGVAPRDLISAQKVAKELELKLKVRKIKLSEIPSYLKKIVPLIEDSNVVKVGVALTFYLACELAKEDGCKVIFSGLGSEEIFAGYDRHKKSDNINQECLSGLLKIYERDLYRDDVITMDNNLELRCPYLDVKLVKYALKIPGKFKIEDSQGKMILRKVALEKGISPENSFRKKTAAQYGSRLDGALEKLAKQNGHLSKSSYLKQFYPSHNLRLGVLFSSGKDSTYAAYIMQKQNYQLSCLITIKSNNPDSYMFHTPAIELALLQAEAMELPIILQETEGVKETELKDLEKAIKYAKEKYQIDGIITGAIFSTYQRDRVEKLCDILGLKVFSPLWHKPQERQMQELLDNKFKFIFTSIAADGLDKSWLNKVITKKELELLKKLEKKIGSNIAGEGGEFESLVLDCPLFSRKLIIKNVDVVEENKFTAHLIIKKAKLIEKKELN